MPFTRIHDCALRLLRWQERRLVIQLSLPQCALTGVSFTRISLRKPQPASDLRIVDQTAKLTAVAARICRGAVVPSKSQSRASLRLGNPAIFQRRFVGQCDQSAQEIGLHQEDRQRHEPQPRQHREPGADHLLGCARLRFVTGSKLPGWTAPVRSIRGRRSNRTLVAPEFRG